MNLKINLWTVLFLLVAGAWWYTAQGTSDNDPYPYDELEEYEIRQDRFIFGRKLYNEFYNEHINVDGFPKLAYPIVSYYTVSQKEIASLHKHGDSIQVYAVPFIDHVFYKKEGATEQKCIPVVNIAFSTVKPNKKPNDINIEGGKYLQFLRPLSTTL